MKERDRDIEKVAMWDGQPGKWYALYIFKNVSEQATALNSRDPTLTTQS